MPSATNRRRKDDSIRLTLAAELGQPLDGAWWPHTSSVARELPELIEALEPAVGQVVDISVNWSALAGTPDLDKMNWRVGPVVADKSTSHHRVMTVTGSRSRVRLLIVPCRTSTALAVMVLRQAARLPIMPIHLDTDACRLADGIVRAARAENQPATGSV